MSGNPDPAPNDIARSEPAAAGGTPPVVLHLDGQELFAPPRDELFARLTDLAFLLRCMPDLDTVIATEATRIVFKVKPGFSFVRGTLEITLELIESHRPDAARMRIVSKGVGSGVKLETTFTLSDAADSTDSRTCVAWSADIHEISGLLKPIGKSLIAAGARKVIGDAFSRVRAELGVIKFPLPRGGDGR
jgi:carbon monoxide dehydrogenase subunit G